MTGTIVSDKVVGNTHHIFTDLNAAGGDTDCFRCDVKATWQQRGSERSPDHQVEFTLDIGFDNSTRGLSFDSQEPGDWTSGEWHNLGDHFEVMVETSYNRRDRSVEVHWRKKGEREEHRLRYTCIPNSKVNPAEEHVQVTFDGRFLIHWMMPAEQN